MSHFVALVLVNGAEHHAEKGLLDRAKVEKLTGELLDPYDENKVVPRYKSFLDAEEVKRMAKHYKLKPRDLHGLVSKMEDWTNQKGGTENGEFFHWSTYNPQSQWDWWVIGGRWTGYLNPAYDIEKDPRNFETCTLCQGTGDRKDLEPPEWKKQCNGCNVCHGTGRSRRFSSADFPGDVQHPAAAVNLDKLEHYPYAIVTPDGEWHSKGKMGWWGMSRNNKAEKKWHEECRKLLAAHPLATVVVCDLHI